MIRITRDPAFAPCAFIIMRAPFDPRDEANTVLIQTDWDYPSVASAFGFDMKLIQKAGVDIFCDHSGTDGTVACLDCGLTAGDFIEAAREYLDECVADEREAEDPGYFSE